MAKKQRHNQKQKQKSQKSTAKQKTAEPVEKHAAGDGPANTSAEYETVPHAAANASARNSGDLRYKNNVNRVNGLTNLGNTCYFNAMVQVLLSSSTVAKEYLGPAKRGPIGQGLHEVTKAAHGLQAQTQSPSGNQRPGKKRKLEESAKNFNPQQLHSSLLRIAPHLKINQQQDSHEAMRLLLDGLHREELKTARMLAKGSAPSQPEGEEGEAEPSLTFVSKAFGMQLASRIECLACQYESSSLEDFMDISVEIVQAGEEEPTSSNIELAGQGKKGKKGEKQSKQEKGKKGTKLANGDGSQLVDKSSSSGNPSHTAKQMKKMAKEAKKAASLERRKERRQNAERIRDQVEGDSQSTGELPAGSHCSPNSSAISQREGSANEQEALHEDESEQTAAQDCQRLQARETDAESFLTAAEHQQSTEAGQMAPQGGADKGQSCKEASSNALERPSKSSGNDPTSPKIHSPIEASQNLIPSKEDIDSLYETLWDSGDPIAVPPPNKDGLQQLGDEDDNDVAIGSLFDVPANGEVAGSPHAESPAAGLGAAGLSLEACLEAFFKAEEVVWECPGEKEARQKNAQAGMTTPANQSQRGMHRSVSFSAEKPTVKLIPGSVEQRGTNFRQALEGLEPFCRPLKLEDASLLVTAEIDTRCKNIVHVGLDPTDDSPATMSVLAKPFYVMDVSIPKVKDPDDEEEQAAVAQRAQLLMDCVADLVLHEGVEGMQTMVEGGVWFRSADQHKSVCGNIPEGLGGGTWEYPLQTPKSTESPKLSKWGSYLSCQLSSPGSSLIANAHSQSPDEPNTPAANSATSFESIDLSSSPMKPVSGGFSPEFQTLTSESGTASQGKDSELKYTSGSVASKAGPQSETLSEDATETVISCSRADNSASDFTEEDDGEPSLQKHSNGVADGEHVGSVLSGSAGSQAQSSGKAAERRSASSASQQANGAAPSSEEWNGSQTSNEESALEASPPPTSMPTAAAIDNDRKQILPPSSQKRQKAGLINVQRSAKKGYSIHRAPQLLTVHLKRFQIDFRGKPQKITGPMPFKPDLNITPFCDPKGLHAEGAQYELVGVIEHQGSGMRTGHYVAYVKRSTQPEGASEPFQEQIGDHTGVEARQPTSQVLQEELEVVGPNNSKGAASAGAESSDSYGQDAETSAAESRADESGEEQDQRGGAARSSTCPLHTRHECNGRSAEKGAGGLKVDQAQRDHGADQQTQWYYASDTTIRKVTLDEVLASEPYVLLYQRRLNEAK